MRTALLHYWLTNMRGGEQVLAALGSILPEADIYTHAFGRKMRTAGEGDFWLGHRVRETFIASLPFGRRKPQAYLPLMRAATRRLDLGAYGLIVSSESGPIKGIRKPSGARHVCYCHTPMRYLWDLHDEYYRDAGLLGKLAMKLFTPSLRRADLESAESVDTFVANSNFVAERIKRLYGRESVVVNPPVDTSFYSGSVRGEGDYYLFAGAPVKYKRLDIAKAACERMGRKLVVAGGGGFSREDLRQAYSGARALLFPGIEDFGIVPVEAQAAGTPVIALGLGGATETVIDGETGLFFKDQTVDGLCAAIEEFESRAWSHERCRENAKRFSADVFASRMKSVLVRA
ncbi:MAG: glycosyltransferase [Kiritimatiellae bacterium]|nr:glycosyltransferase [Kiritimatiellia bacterium]